jgi:hypothetical protein
MAKHRQSRTSVVKGEYSFKVNTEGGSELTMSGAAALKVRAAMMLAALAVTAYNQWHGLDVGSSHNT